MNILKNGIILLSMIVFPAPGLTSCRNQGEEPKPPNIILFFTDDLGYGDLGVYGQKLISTPRLDKMAEEGMRFTRFYTANPVCAPSRCSLLTGKHAGRAYIRDNNNVYPLGQVPIPEEEITIAELLKEAGYATAAMGKWSLGSLHNSGDPLKQGFDQFFGYYCQCRAHNYYPDMVWRNRDSVKLANETVPVKVNWSDFILSYATKKVDNSAVLALGEALGFIEENKEGPFFLYFPTTLPHSNGEAPPDERFEVPSWGIYSDSAWTPVEKGYASMVTLIDSQVGAMLDKLEELEIDDNTLVIFTSDNGPTLFAKIFESAGAYKGRKRDLYEGGTRMPMIARWPGQIQAGSVCDYQSATYDLMATFCEAAGLEVPDFTDGTSLLPFLEGARPNVRDFLYWEIHEGERSPKQAVTRGNWKLIRFSFTDPEKQELELYDLDNDPWEENNLLESHPDMAEELLSLMEREHSEYQLSGIDSY